MEPVEKSQYHSSTKPEAIELLQESIGKVVRITRPDGEIIIAKIDLVDPLDEEIVTLEACLALDLSLMLLRLR